MKVLLVFLCLLGGLCGTSWATEVKTLLSYRTDNDFVPDADPEKFAWQQPFTTQTIVHNWRGDEADWALETSVKSLWTPTYLYLLFEAKYDELDVDSGKTPDANGDTFGIWEHDVVELFIGDNPDIRKYREFVVSPLGQHIDITHDKNLPDDQSYDISYQSGWEVAAAIDPYRRCWVAELRIPMAAVASEPATAGKAFRANAYRCARAGDRRAYLAMNPTETPRPKFHKPEKFGRVVLAEAPTLPAPLAHVAFNPASDAAGDLRFTADGPRARLGGSGGVAGSPCLDMQWPETPPRAAPVLDGALVSGLNSARSLTVTGWLYRQVDFDDRDNQHQYVFCAPGVQLLSEGRYRNRLALFLDGADGKRRQLWSGWIHDFQPPGRWIFFALTYDGSAETDNAAIYYGYEQYAVRRESINTVPGGPLTDGIRDMVIGARTAVGDSPFKGRLDSLRIYAAADGSAALNADQLEVIRRADVTDAFRRELARSASAQRQAQVRAYHRDVEQLWSGPLAAHRIDPLQAVYPDRPPQPWAETDPIVIPRGDHMVVMVGCRAAAAARLNFSAEVDRSAALGGRITGYQVLPVPIEANNNGGSNTQVGVKPPPYWMEQITREAPFEVCEVLVEADAIDLQAGRWYAVLIDIATDRTAAPGPYIGRVRLSLADGPPQTVPFTFHVAATALDDQPALHSTHWMWADPANFVVDDPPPWWSPRHWELLEASGRVLRDYGQDTVLTPLINERHPLIGTFRRADGSYRFDFTRFDHWVEMFRAQGYRIFQGQHVGGGHSVRPMEVWVVDEQTGREEPLFNKESDVDAWLDFLEVFYPALFAHLQQRGWVDIYVQAQLDEPHEPDAYMRLASLARKHMPGVRTMDAINGEPEVYSPHVDIQVFNSLLARAALQDVARQRRAEGKGVWYYHCCSPYPPYPNRHLDEPLTGSRLYPWLCYLLNADGYLFWAANVLRGANPYETSVGPLPGGSQTPGHPPGDNWMFYPSERGLRGTLRMTAFRQGLVDHELLVRLARREPERARQFMSRIARSLLDYETDPAVYRRVRRDLLAALEKQQP